MMPDNEKKVGHNTNQESSFKGEWTSHLVHRMVDTGFGLIREAQGILWLEQVEVDCLRQHRHSEMRK
jgi:hypothetical protein